MTHLQLACAEMALAQSDQQQLHRVANAMNTGKVPRTPMNLVGLVNGYAMCEHIAQAASRHLTRFAAANDNTMVMGAA